LDEIKDDDLTKQYGQDREDLKDDFKDNQEAGKPDPMNLT